MTHVAVIDYGMGNLHSVAKALEHAGAASGQTLRVDVSSDPGVLRSADRLVFPGVGAIRDCMAEICRLGIDTLLREQVQQKPVLAICVGMQALLQRSEENGGVDCIGLCEGTVRRFTGDARDAQGNLLKVPHMGWSQVNQTLAHPLWQGIANDERFYFVHSYYVDPAASVTVAGTSEYPQRFCAALTAPNLFAVQFHPEKSQRNGLQLLQNFLNWNGQA